MEPSPAYPPSRAVVMERYGPPDVLQYVEIRRVPPSSREVSVRTLVAAINHTDLEIRAGNWPIRKAAPFPYVPGVEVIGTIEAVGNEVRDVAVGQTVITMMQGLGGVRADRPGGYADVVTVDADSIAIVDGGVDPVELAALGLGAVTAEGALERCGALMGKRVLVTGATGGVGSAASALARAAGATVIGVVSRRERIDEARRVGAAEVLVSTDRLPAASIDYVIDTVAGSLFGPAVNALRPKGILCLVGAVAGANVMFDSWQLINPVTLTGYSSEHLTGADLRRAVGKISALLAGRCIAVPSHKMFSLKDAAEAHRQLEQRELTGRALLISDYFATV